jgi:hypothetical protein
MATYVLVLYSGVGVYVGWLALAFLYFLEAPTAGKEYASILHENLHLILYHSGLLEVFTSDIAIISPACSILMVKRNSFEQIERINALFLIVEESHRNRVEIILLQVYLGMHEISWLRN